jgi:hypothetical protein
MDLPTELLDLICQEVDLDGLLALACLCSRLHRIALPILFDRTGFNGSSVSVRDQRFGDAFVKISKAIRLSLTTTKLDHLDCILSVEERGVTVRMKELRKLFSQPTLVSRVDLRFADAARGTVFPGTFFALLNSLANTKCDRLHIRFPRLSYYSAGIGRKVEWKPVHTCKEITISMEFFVEALLKWLVLSINSSPIQTFRFYNNPRACDTTIKTALPQLLLDHVELPHLTKLHISTIVAGEDILKILTRHSTVQTFNFNPPSIQNWDVSQESSVCTLPCLTRLAAPAGLVCRISAQGVAPKLHTVHLHLERPGRFSDFVRSFIAALVAISSCPTVHHLSLSMNGGSPVVELMRLCDVSFMPQLVSSHITHLTLFSAQFSVVELFSQWIVALFPNLEFLMFHELLDPDTQIDLRRQLKEISPTVVLAFDDNESTQWLSEPAV